jgi:hypothetical protein
MALTVAECIMALLAAREVASRLGLKEWGQGAASVVLGGVACTIASDCARYWAAVEAAGTLGAIEGTERA